MQNTLQPVVWITANTELKRICELWCKVPVLAIDTEFMRTDTYYPIPALLQVFDGDANYLLDPLMIDDFAPLAQVLTAPGVLKVFHACSEDLEVFLRLVGVVPAPLFDTQLAAAFCGLGYSRGYAALVEALLHTTLPKEETRSDWLARPLSDAQVLYAACDVEYLFNMHARLRDQLHETGRYGWALDESAGLVEQVVRMQAAELAFLKFKGAWRLPPRNLAALLHIATWRERTAQQKNLPRGRVVDNKSVYGIAERMPMHIAQLRHIEAMRESTIRRYGSQLVAFVRDAEELPESELPEVLTRPLSGAEQKLVKQLRLLVDSKAETLQIAPELLASRRDLEALLQLPPDAAWPPSLSGWRAPILNEILKQFYDQTSV